MLHDDIRDYVCENWRLSVRIWEAANMTFAAVGALIALALAALASIWEFSLTSYGVRLITIFPGLFFLTIFFVVTPFRMWCAEGAKVSALQARLNTRAASQTIVAAARILHSSAGVIFARSISSDAEMASFAGDFATLIRSISPSMEATGLTDAEIATLISAVPGSAFRFDRAFNAEHNNGLLALQEIQRRLARIIERFSVPYVPPTED